VDAIGDKLAIASLTHLDAGDATVLESPLTLLPAAVAVDSVGELKVLFRRTELPREGSGGADEHLDTAPRCDAGCSNVCNAARRHQPDRVVRGLDKAPRDVHPQEELRVIAAALGNEVPQRCGSLEELQYHDVGLGIGRDRLVHRLGVCGQIEMIIVGEVEAGEQDSRTV
jgi:hypothetical protein